MEPDFPERIRWRIARQREFFTAGHTRSETFRRRALRKLYDTIEASQRALADALWDDLHKSPEECLLAETGPVLGEIGDQLRHLKRRMRTRRKCSPAIVFPGRSRIQPEPLGTVLIVAPWNYPFMLLFDPLAGAVAAGNCVVLKTSENTPNVSRVMGEIVAKAFDERHVIFTDGGREENEALLTQRFDYIFFTGGPRVGSAVMEAAAKNLTPVTLELGGKSPCIVGKEADLALAARRIVWGKFMNAGQTCIAPDYLLAQREIKEELVGRIGAEIRRFYGDDPRESPYYGRIVTVEAAERLAADLRASGTVVFGGGADPARRYIAPTLVDEPADESPLMRHEIFGPVLPVKAFDTIEEAAARINKGEKPLALYYFGPRAEARYLLKHTSSGGAAVNDTLVQIANRRLPFGGVGGSGMGSYHGRRSFETFSHYKAVVLSGRPDVSLRYPPYRHFGLIKNFLKR